MSSRSKKQIDAENTLLMVAGAFNGLRQIGYVEGFDVITVSGLAHFDQLMAAPWRPSLEGTRKALDAMIDHPQLGLTVDQETKDDLIGLIWERMHHGFEEQRVSDY